MARALAVLLLLTGAVSLQEAAPPAAAAADASPAAPGAAVDATARAAAAARAAAPLAAAECRISLIGDPQGGVSSLKASIKEWWAPDAWCAPSSA